MFKTLHFFTIIFLSGLFFTSAVHADKTQELRKIESTLENSKKEKNNLEKAKKQHSRKLSSLKKDLVSQSKKVRHKEQDLYDINAKLDDISVEIKQRTKTLKQQQKDSAHLVIAAARVAEVPPQAMIARSGAPIDIARTNMILKSTLPILNKQTNTLQDNILELDKLESELKRKRALAEIVKKELQERQVMLESKLSKRKTLLKKTDKNRATEEKNIAKLKAKSKNLKSLITALQNDPSLSDTAPQSSSILSGLRKSGFTMPVSGRVKTNYGQKTSSGKSDGLTLESTPGALVVSPYAGTVKFAGPFRTYKLIVIIEHEQGYHSLLAGLSEIYLPVGTKVLAGEPVGKLKGDQSTKTSLYYELRRNGKPTNPNKNIKLSG